MKKAILLKPELLAESKIISPDLYEYYCNSPISRIEFADYGTPYLPMFMPKKMLDFFKYLTKQSNEPSQMMESFQCGWAFGYSDLFSSEEGEITDTNREKVKKFFFDCAIHYPHYDFYSLINRDNFVIRDRFLYNKLTYQESQCLEAWRFMLKCPEEFNDFFIEFNSQKRRMLDLGLSFN
ncbi:MAG TPA: hypothetical protein VGK10_21240 [Prolixibacteraceae bacterium]